MHAHRVFPCVMVPATETGEIEMGQLARGLARAVVTSLVIVAGAAMATEAPPITIGVQAPMSGQYALEGLGIARGAKMLARQRNAAGGLLGRKISVIVCDDQGNAPQAAMCARKLVMAGAIAVVGTYTSDAALVAGPIYAAADVIQTSGSNGNVLTTKGWNTFFRNAPSSRDEATFVANYLVNVRHFRRIALLHDHSQHAISLAESVAKEVTNQQGNVVANVDVTTRGKDYTRLLKDLKSNLPDAVFYAGSYARGGLIRAQMVHLGIPAAFMGSTENRNPGFAHLAGSAAKGTIVVVDIPAPNDLPYPAARKFLDDYIAMYGSAPPDIYALTNADGLRAVFAAIEATKSTDASKLIPWMRHLQKPFDGITGPITWDQHGDRLGTSMAAFELQADGSYTKVYTTH